MRNKLVLITLLATVAGTAAAAEKHLIIDNQAEKTFLFIEHQIQIDGVTTSQDELQMEGAYSQNYYYSSTTDNGTLQISIDYCDSVVCLMPQQWSRACYVTVTEQGPDSPPKIQINNTPQAGNYRCVQDGDYKVNFVKQSS